MASLEDNMRITKTILYDGIGHVGVFFEGLPEATLLGAYSTPPQSSYHADEVEAFVAFDVLGTDAAVLELAVITGHPEDGVRHAIGQYREELRRKTDDYSVPN
ncbi:MULTISPECIES: hypothetical protein [unclassified Neorhizobium]|jgi:hypothetical protein|uniref:hypothetical protein n=1 Tax=unclassified Neorhizobium TaxID=2629175 RepID=UPI001050E517|nr:MULTISPECIES: hypothetical protein [unclassified Neorhizobium]